MAASPPDAEAAAAAAVDASPVSAPPVVARRISVGDSASIEPVDVVTAVPMPAQQHAPLLRAISMADPEEDTPLLDSVVKVFSTSLCPNFSLPWTVTRQSNSTSSGFIIEGRRILCNAHGVAFQQDVRVRKPGDPEEYTAKVIAVGHECDLALLTVEQDRFWKDMKPLHFGGTPRLQEEVVVVGYPTGGDNISVTQGVVSRVDVMSYAHSLSDLLAIQIDAAINPGNSGGPTFKDGLVVGVAFESMEAADGIGYIIPVEIIQHFLDDITRNGKYTGFPCLGFSAQYLKNPGMRRRHGLADGQEGLLVCQIAPTHPVAKVMKVKDVLLEYDGVPVASDGTVAFRKSERVSFRYLTSKKFVGDKASLTLLRDGKRLDVEFEQQHSRAVVPLHLYDKLPQYYVWAGMVFTVLSRPYLINEFGTKWSQRCPIKIADITFHGTEDFPGHEVVVLSHILTDSVNKGLQGQFFNSIVKKVNDTPVRNLRHLEVLISTCDSEFVDFSLDQCYFMSIEKAAGDESLERVMTANFIGAPSRKDPPQAGERPFDEPPEAADSPEVESGDAKVVAPASSSDSLVPAEREDHVLPPPAEASSPAPSAAAATEEPAESSASHDPSAAKEQ